MSTPKLLSALAEAGQPYDGELTFNAFIRYGKRQTDTYHWLIIHPVGGDHLAAYFGDWRKGSSQAFKSWENGIRLDADKARALERELDQRRRAQELADQREASPAGCRAGAGHHRPCTHRRSERLSGAQSRRRLWHPFSKTGHDLYSDARCRGH